MNTSLTWFFVINCIAYLPLACDSASEVIRESRPSFWLLFFTVVSVCMFMFLMAYNTKKIFRYYGGRGSVCSIARENLSVYDTVIAAAASIADYVLTVVIMALYFGYFLSFIFGFGAKGIMVSSFLLLLVCAVLNFRKFRVPLRLSGVLSALFFVIVICSFIYLFNAIGKTELLPDFAFVFSVEEGKSIYAKIFAEVKLFASLSFIVIGFDIARSKNIYIKGELTEKGVYRVAFFVSALLFVTVFFVYESLTADSFSASLAGGNIHSILYIALMAFLSAVMAVNTYTSFAALPSLGEELAQMGFFPTMFKNSRDDIMFAVCLFLTFVLTASVLVFSQGNIDRLTDVYAIGVFISFAITHFAMSKKIKDSNKARLTALVSSLFMTVFAAEMIYIKFTKGGWGVLVCILLLALFMGICKLYYTRVNRELRLTKNERGAGISVRATSVVIITDLDKGIIPAVRYAVSIADDARVVYVAGDGENEDELLADWEFYFPNIPLIVLKNHKNSNIIQPIMQYIDCSLKGINKGIITVVLPEYVPSKPYFMIFHRNYAFLLKILLGFKKGVITVSVPYSIN